MLFHTLLAAGLPLTTALTHAALDSQPAAAELSLDKRQSICGVSGYDDDNHKPFEVILKKAWNAEQCSAYCKSRARCQSFAIGNDECKLYCEPVSGTYKSGRSQYKFYGRDCPYSPSKQSVNTAQTASQRPASTGITTMRTSTRTSSISTSTISTSTTRTSTPGLSPTRVSTTATTVTTRPTTTASTTPPTTLSTTASESPSTTASASPSTAASTTASPRAFTTTASTTTASPTASTTASASPSTTASTTASATASTMTASPTASTTTASTTASTSTSTTASTTTASPTASTTASTTTASTTTASPTASTTTASTTASTSTPNTINPTCATFFLQAIEDGSFLSASVDGNNIVSTADSSAATRYRIDGNQLIDASTSSIWSKNSGTTIDAVKTQDSLPATEIAITCEFLPETANTLSCEDPTNTAVNKLGFCASLDNSLALADGGADCTFYNYRAVCETSPFTPPFLISATDPATGSFLGYITAAYFSFGIRDLTTTASEALQVTYDPSSGETGHPSQLTITSLNSADYQDLTLLSILAFVQTSEDNPPQDMRSGSNNYGFLGNSQSTPRGQTSQDVDSSIQRATGVVLPSQTAIWTVNGITHELSALWINTPDVPPATATLVPILNSNGGNGVYFTGDAEALSARFPGETWQALRLRLVSVGERVVG